VRHALATALLGLTLGLTAALFDAATLRVPAVALVVLAATTVAWVGLSARGLRVTRTVSARRVVEGEPLAVRIDVRAGRLPLCTGQLVDPLLDAPVSLRAGRRTARVRVQVRFARRGRRVLDAPRVLLADPLGLARREVRAPDDGGDEVLVLPRLEPVLVAREGEDGARTARRGRPAPAADSEPDGLRALREGTPASRIYWPAIARGAEPQERRLVAGSDTRPLVVLDPRGAEREEDLDAAVRAAASLAHHLARAGGCAVLLPGDRRAATLDGSPASWAHVHARLALVGDGAGPGLGAVAGRRGPVLFVSARRRASLPRGLGASGGERLLVVPRTLAGRRPVLTVAGCNAYAAGTRPHDGGPVRSPLATALGRPA
jgi:uncharacterized protein (DUF58 family)